MAATTNWYEQNGTATGSPAHGTESSISSCDWKSVDDTTTSRASAPVLAGANSYTKYIYLKFSGTFNQVSAVKFAHTAGTLGTGISLVGKITSTYETPATSAMSGSTDITSTTAIGSGAFPMGLLKVQTTASASAGDSGTVTLTVQYNEN